MARQILIIDDKVSESNELRHLLAGFGADIYQSLRIGMAKEELAKFQRGDIVICDFKLADGNAVDLMEWMYSKDIRCSVFVITDVETVADAVASFRAVARDYINKRLIRELLVPKVKALIGRNENDNFPLLLSRKSDACLRAYSYAHIVAPTGLKLRKWRQTGVFSLRCSTKSRNLQLVYRHSVSVRRTLCYSPISI